MTERRRLKGLVRLIDMRKAADRSSAETMVELGEASATSGSAGSVPTCTVDGDDADVFEPYGLAGNAPSSDALVLAPGGDSDTLTALLSSVEGRPATDPGDKALWTVDGHVIMLDNDDGLTITAKDGQYIELDADGDITAAVADGDHLDLGGPAATRGNARLEDLTRADTEMLAWMVASQPCLAVVAALAGLPAPVFPTDFGVINTASTKVRSE